MSDCVDETQEDVENQTLGVYLNSSIFLSNIMVKCYCFLNLLSNYCGKSKRTSSCLWLEKDYCLIRWKLDGIFVCSVVQQKEATQQHFK